ncbi:hypothetical protein CSC2_03190 [Clostridium zeae]|uniref:3D domain-containing protein n=1 Tax=Clostridium zeae TaxID=2759022 RepID=A0ABQ1E4Y0_9CLOT|nr:hypothetical protein [Clostridium zeae]GFZ29793.1 hypothetical protein CSC2_03190 [Clostridium zeae]
MMIKRKALKKVLASGVLTLLSVGVFQPVFASAATTYSNQDFTAYTCPVGGITSSGVAPTPYTTCAVHPSNKSNPYSAPIFPFGTVIKTTKALNLPGYGSKSSFVVQDKGDLAFQKSQYWVDIFFDYENNPNAITNAINFGNQKISYTVN